MRGYLGASSPAGGVFFSPVLTWAEFLPRIKIHKSIFYSPLAKYPHVCHKNGKQRPSPLLGDGMRRLAAGTFLQWWDTGGNRVAGGDWFPTHYAYVDGEPREGFAIQWLVVGPGPVARFQDREIRLEAIPAGCNIKGAEGLQAPCYARAQYKKMYR